MLLRVQTEVSGDVFILRCAGRIVFGDEGAVLRDRVISLLSGPVLRKNSVRTQFCEFFA